MENKNTKLIFSLLGKLSPKYYYFHLRYWIDKIFRTKGMDPKKLLHYYWSRNPIGNEPENYLINEKNKLTSKILVETISRYINPEDSILELGSNVGRNLHFLSEANFKNLSSVEINKSAIDLMKKTFPELCNIATVYNEPIESFLKKNNLCFDLIYTSAVLEHIHYDSEWIFSKIPKIINKYLLTLEIEDNKVDFHRIVGRKYKAIFENLGLTCVEERTFSPSAHLRNYTLRVFRKK